MEDLDILSKKSIKYGTEDLSEKDGDELDIVDLFRFIINSELDLTKLAHSSADIWQFINISNLTGGSTLRKMMKIDGEGLSLTILIVYLNFEVRIRHICEQEMIPIPGEMHYAIAKERLWHIICKSFKK